MWGCVRFVLVRYLSLLLLLAVGGWLSAHVPHPKSMAIIIMEMRQVWIQHIVLLTQMALVRFLECLIRFWWARAVCWLLHVLCDAKSRNWLNRNAFMCERNAILSILIVVSSLLRHMFYSVWVDFKIPKWNILRRNGDNEWPEFSTLRRK